MVKSTPTRLLASRKRGWLTVRVARSARSRRRAVERSEEYPDYAFMRYFKEGYLEPAVQAGDHRHGRGAHVCRSVTCARRRSCGTSSTSYRIGPDSDGGAGIRKRRGPARHHGGGAACGAMLVLCSPRAELRDYVAYARHVNPDVYIVFRPDACDWLADKFPDMKIVTLRCKHEGYPSIESAIAAHRARRHGVRAGHEGRGAYRPVLLRLDGQAQGDRQPLLVVSPQRVRDRGGVPRDAR